MPGAQAASDTSSRHGELLRSCTCCAESTGTIHWLASVGDLAKPLPTAGSPDLGDQEVLLHLVPHFAAPSLRGQPGGEVSNETLGS